MNPSSFLLSVDLGTSHAVAVLRWPDGRTRPLLFDGQPVLPVGVYCDESGELHVGRDAARLSAVSPERFEPNPKRQVAQGVVLLADREVGVAAMFAAALRRVAVVCAQATGTLPETVLTCPSSWSTQRREVLAEAAAQAGFGPVRLVSEPVAAAHYYRTVLDRPIERDEALAVIDFGAGTVDIAVLATDAEGRLSIAAEGGVHDFGGVDIDAAVVDHLRETTSGDHAEAWAALDGPRTGSHRRGRMQLWTDVRETKEMLSRFTVAPVGVPGIEAGLHLTRTELDSITRPLLEPVISEVERVRDAAEAAGHRLGAVFLVGGASRMPLVSNLVHHALDVAPVVIEQPELAVAEGAAVAEVAEAAEPVEEPPTEYSPVAVSEPPTGAIDTGTALPPPPSKQRDRRPRLLVAGIAAGLLAVVLVGVSVLFALRSGGSAGSGGYSAVLSGSAAEACPEGLTASPPETGGLHGPHFTLLSSCLLLLDPSEVGAVADLLEETPEMSDDQRLALVHFPSEGTVLSLPDDSDHEVNSVVALGDQTWEMAGVPAADSVYAAVVADDATATVAVTDAERTQTLDLATGEVADPVSAYYHGELAERSFRYQAHLSMESPDGEWNIASAQFDEEVTVTRAVFDEAQGWLCEEDEAVLTASFRIYVESTTWKQDWPFDAAQNVRINAGDEAIVAHSVDFADELVEFDDPNFTGVYRTFTVVFVVPADLIDMQFAIDPHDRAYDRGTDVWLYTATGGETKVYTVDFNP